MLICMLIVGTVAILAQALVPMGTCYSTPEAKMVKVLFYDSGLSQYQLTKDSFRTLKAVANGQMSPEKLDVNGVWLNLYGPRLGDELRLFLSGKTEYDRIVHVVRENGSIFSTKILGEQMEYLLEDAKLILILGTRANRMDD